MKTLAYITIGLIAAAALVGCGKSSSNNNNNPYPYGQYGQYGQYGGGGCIPTGVAITQAMCQQYGYGWNGTSCISPQGQVIAPGTCGGGYTGYPNNSGYPGYGNGYNYNYGYSGYTGYTYTMPYGAPYYIPTMPYYYNQRR